MQASDPAAGHGSPCQQERGATPPAPYPLDPLGMGQQDSLLSSVSSDWGLALAGSQAPTGNEYPSIAAADTSEYAGSASQPGQPSERSGTSERFYSYGYGGNSYGYGGTAYDPWLAAPPAGYPLAGSAPLGYPAPPAGYPMQAAAPPAGYPMQHTAAPMGYPPSQPAYYGASPLPAPVAYAPAPMQAAPTYYQPCYNGGVGGTVGSAVGTAVGATVGAGVGLLGAATLGVVGGLAHAIHDIFD